MFGYIRTYNPQLRLCEIEAYKAVYCGLCHHLGKRFGPIARLTLSYDFTFLALLDIALREEEVTAQVGRCAFNPLKKVSFIPPSSSVAYACDMAQMVLFHKLWDDIVDNGFWKGLGARLGLLLVKQGYHQAAKRYPELGILMTEAMARQAIIEQEKTACLDEACQPTADILSTILGALAHTPRERRILERLGLMLGRYIYLADAMDDLEEDQKAGRYNPFLLDFTISNDERRGAGMASLYLTIAEAGAAYELLEVRRFESILENIFFMGLRAQADQLCCLAQKSRVNSKLDLYRKE